MKTKVIFRKFPEGDVIALFPELAGTNDFWGTCSSYQRIGQHGSASVDLVYSTRLASPEEYAELKAELESIGYELEIVKKFTSKHLEARKQEISR